MSQEEPDAKEEYPVYYYSRLLNPAERNYSTTDHECLAVIAAVKKFRVYVLGAPLEIRTDHAAVRQLLNKIDATGRYARLGMYHIRVRFYTPMSTRSETWECRWT